MIIRERLFLSKKYHDLHELKKTKEGFDFFNLNVMRPLGTEIYPGILKVTHKKYGKKTPNIWLSNYIITSKGARKILFYLKKDIKGLNRNFDSMSREEIDNYISDLFEEKILPDKFIVHNNYPNPFNPKTTIVYEIPKISNVEIQIINMRGQIIDRYTSKNISPGIYDYIWEAENYSSGIYFYRFYLNDKVVARKKMIYIK